MPPRQLSDSHGTPKYRVEEISFGLRIEKERGLDDDGGHCRERIRVSLKMLAGRQTQRIATAEKRNEETGIDNGITYGSFRAMRRKEQVWHNLPTGNFWRVFMPTRNVVLTDHQAAFVEQLVESGRYQNASEVLREGLRLIEGREAEDKARLKALREAARVGVEDFEAGRFRSFPSSKALARHLTSMAEKAITTNKSTK